MALVNHLFEYTAFQKWSISHEAKIARPGAELLLAGLGFFCLRASSNDLDSENLPFLGRT